MNKKDTIYVDPDEDITGIIDRVNSAGSKIVAVVLPKRAQVLHSSVNMRLLKRAADSKGKKLVLISNEPSVLKLAATAEIHVASALNSKPYLPKSDSPKDDVAEVISSDNMDTPIDAKKSIGELAGLPVKENVQHKDEEPIELDNVDVADKKQDDTKPEGKMNKKLKVPNIDRFRNRIFIGGGAVLLVGVLYFIGAFIMPKATITIKTDTSDLETKFELVAKTDAKDLDVEKKIFPAQLKELKVNLTEKVTATGKVNKGNKATGSITLFNCNKADTPVTLPSGSRLVVSDLGYITNKEVTVPVSNFTGGGSCKKDSSANVDVTAESGGGVYNIDARGGYVAPSNPDITGTGSDMNGGTDKLVTSISQEDVDAIKATLQKGSTDKDKEQLSSQLRGEGLFPLTETFLSSFAEPVVAPAIGEEATSGTVTIAATYTMLAIKESDLLNVMKKVQESNITTATQKIYDTGLSKAKVGQLERKSPNESRLMFSTTATVGPFLDATVIANEVKGKSAGDTKSIISNRPGITEVDLQYSPFWVFKTPNRLNKIQIIFDGAGEVR